ncbi:ribosome small subunit-dependent GTPase A [Aureibacillus halotolerans]|uniref:Small ribosomal subunit biogenesis GTPase RsgA n=1 Tax=Aureibacillus halotolerans TaxID=1508390 RepID=A0A4R6UGV4_9BACI|nr:ribosome small subunit-dependent GTPase A [Aureibacillus halotolerans]TDQ42374.1 ribosome biogenesis GTPase [Aureibacillus halotolerans]
MTTEGKIIKALSGFYYVQTDTQVYQCKARGLFRKTGESPLVGDQVVFAPVDEMVLEIKPRKNALVRPPIANIDQALLVFSARQPDFQTTLLDRFLVVIEAYDIEPIICVSKTDLPNEEDIAPLKNQVNVYEQMGYQVMWTSAETKNGLDHFLPLIQDKISVVAGQSGVGKSSLLNAVAPELSLKTDEISRSLGRGKHTTRHVELLPVGGGWIADTPGFSSLDFDAIASAEELSQYFIDFHPIMADCRFRGCTHMKEPKCAVKAAVEHGDIADFRYKHYQQFFEEIKDRKERY